MEQIAKEARLKVLDMVYKAQSSHIGSNFSCIDIMTAIFDRIDLDKDKFILSAGWKAASLYYFLWKKGRITLAELDSYCKEGSKFIGLAEPIHPDIAFSGGSMGYGLPAAVGFALSKKLRGERGVVYCLMSDGELAIGTTWESALIAAQHKLDNLMVVVDNNGFQAMGKKDDILKSEFPSEGWHSLNNSGSTDGHNLEHLKDVLSRTVNAWGYLITRPKYLIANTIKGKGVSFMENNNEWHYRYPTKEEYLAAKKELCQ